jgi:hypothetical protein
MVQDVQPDALQVNNMYLVPEKASFPARSSSMSSLRDSADQPASLQVEHKTRNELSSSMRDLTVSSSAPLNGHSTNNLSKSQPSSLPRLAVDNLQSSQSPPSADALHIQRTYQRISQIGGIPRDGFVEGVELTRERKSEATINGYLSPRLHGHAEDDEGEGISNGQRGKVFGDLLSAEDGPDEQGRMKNSSPSSRKASGATTNSVRTRQEEQEEEEQQEYRFLEKVDRYGFFEPTYGRYSRLALLSRKECLELPPKKLSKGKAQANGPSPGTDKKAKRRSLIANSSGGNSTAPGSPYLSVPTPNTSGASSLASSTMSSNLRASRNGGLSATSLACSTGPGGVPNNTTTPLSTLAKENSRTDKWYTEMLVPGDRDSGGNIIQWKFSDRILTNEKRLRRRVAKGIPDRWRAAAWEALILRTEDQAGFSSRRKKSQMSNRETIKRFYALILEPCAQDVQIDLDVPRTISGHLYFHTRYGLGQRALFNVLHAFALHCSDCGYCQGMGSLAATFLCYLPPEVGLEMITSGSRQRLSIHVGDFTESICGDGSRARLLRPPYDIRAWVPGHAGMLCCTRTACRDPDARRP